MKMERLVGLAIGACVAWGTGCSSAEGPSAPPSPPPPAAVHRELPPGPVSAAALHESWKGVPLGDASDKGLRWLISVQGSDGGWGQDGGHEGDAREGVNLESQGNDLANTSLVCLALLRSGLADVDVPARTALDKGLQFVLGSVEEAPAEGLAVTKRQGTQIQRKLGPFIDTFLTTLLLSDMDGRPTDRAAQARVRAALNRCIAKIEKNQQKDGSWNIGGGWAPVIGTSFASQSLFNAQQKGNAVDAACLRRIEEYTKNNLSPDKKQFNDAGGAGVELYQAAQALEQASRPTGAGNRLEARDVESITTAAHAKLSAPQFIAGFGSMGGEEFVSYLNISGSLVRAGGKEWKEWNGTIKERLVKLQNQDGTWAGHHCITGRVACTSAAVMTLLTERTAPKL